MALASTTVIEVETGGNDANGGAFNPGNANFATDGAATSANTASPVFTSASYTFVAADVGAWLFIKSGTNWTPGWYKIASVSAGAVTLSAAVGAAILYEGASANRASIAAGCATVASPTAATWGVDYSQQSAAQIAFTDMVIDGTTNTKFTSAANPVGKNFIGNHINVTGGTGFTAQWVEVVSTSGTAATCDKSLGTLSSTGGTGNLGGALASPGQAGSFKVAGMNVFVKSGTYTISNTTANTSGGPVTDSTGGTNDSNVAYWCGYQTSRCRGNTGTKPLLQVAASGVTSITMFNGNGQWVTLENIDVDGQGKATITGISLTNNFGTTIHCKAANCVTGISQTASQAFAFRCEATGCSTTGISTAGTVVACESYANSGNGFNSNSSSTLMFCNSYGNAIGFTTGGGSPPKMVNCTARNNSSHGFDLSGSPNSGMTLWNCLAAKNGGVGFNSNSNTTRDQSMLYNCAGWANTSGDYSSTTLTRVYGFISCTADPNTSDTDLSLNSTSGGGALLRGAGYPGLMPSGNSTGYIDVGGLQHQDAGGGGSGGLFTNSFSGGML